MRREDDRTAEQRKTHRIAVVGRDTFLSGWGGARGGYSRAAWACGPGVDVNRVERWVRARGDMKYVNAVNLDTYRPPRGTAHFHVYVCDVGHVAAR